MTTESTVYKLRILSLNDVISKLGMSHSAAASALLRWQEQGVIKMVRKNMYLVIDPASGSPLADKYELTSHITTSSYVGWHTALEFHGVAHQPFYNSYVGSNSRFNDFTFDNIDYRYCASPLDTSEDCGIISPQWNPYVRVTDLERTLVDCCDKIGRAGGLEELLHCMEGITLLSEKKLAKYLEKYNKTFLYQKIGFILELSKAYHNVSPEFMEMCRTKGAVHTMRLNDIGSLVYVNRWKLYVPKDCITNNNDTDELI